MVLSGIWAFDVETVGRMNIVHGTATNDKMLLIVYSVSVVEQLVTLLEIAPPILVKQRVDILVPPVKLQRLIKIEPKWTMSICH